MDERVKKWNLDIEEEMRRNREAANFKANPAKVLDQPQFKPTKSDKPLAEVSNFELHSDKRARDREEFEMRKKQREAGIEVMKREVS